jgi:Mg2+ and Co2+ transporter CorA
MGHVEIVELLLKQKDVQFAARDSRGNTPLIDAARSTERQQILQLLAPWNDLFIKSLPQNVKQVAQTYDANIIDFQKAVGSKMLRRKIPVSDLLYKECGEAGSLSHNHVSTRPDPGKEGAFRWIHLPANNLHWAQALLTKHFIEGSVDVESFRALERSLSQQQYRGRRIHSRFMRPACTRLIRRLGDYGHAHHRSTHGPTDDSPIVDLKGRGRINSNDVAEVAENKTAPPSPKGYINSAARDFSGLRIKLEPKVVEDLQTHKKTTEPLRLKIQAPPPIGNMSAVMESGQATVAFPERKTSPTTEKLPEAQELGAYLFMPYLTLENKDKVRIMHDQLRDDHRSSSTSNIQTESTGSSSNEKSPPGRDQKLHQAYSQWKKNDYCLHVRRTLDQFWYRNVDTAVRDGDQVVQRYQAKEKKPTSEIDSLMVDQLWVWVLGPSLIVTSFPQNWQHPRGEVPDLLGSILEEIDPRNGTPVQSVYELAACVVGHCLSSCDQTADNTKQESRSSVLEMFGSSVGDAMNQEVILFSRFQKASEIASEWVQALSDIKQDAEEAQRNLEKKYLSKTGEDTSRSTITGEPIFIEVLLNIHTETKLLEEVKDIQDELGILLQVVDDQQGVHKDICATFGPLLRTEGGPYQARSSGILDEQNMLLEQQRAEIENMLKQVKSTYKSITDLLDLKQKQANVFEARAARKLAVETARAGGTLMVFTIVTVIFLPLSFLAAFFAIVLEGLPYNADDRLPLNFILKYVVGVGLSTALAFVLMAWHHHSAVRWYQNALRWSQGKVAKARPPLKNAARGMWYVIFIRWLKLIFEWKARRRDGNSRTGNDGSSRDVRGSDQAKASPSSSSTVRERRPNLHDDLEKGRD